MNIQNQKWHNDVLAAYQAHMFETLIWQHNIVTESAKSYEFEDEDEIEIPEGPLRGYFAMKDIDNRKTKYFLKEPDYERLPIRVNDSKILLFKESARIKSVVLWITDVTPFKIKPEKCFTTNKEFIDTLAPFEHSHPDQWTLNKIIAVMGYVGKTFVGISGPPEFGKSSIYSIIDSLTKKSPVFQPRSVPGLIIQINNDGNMVFDDIHAVPSEVLKVMENFAFHVASNAPIYINGAMKAHHLKQHYDVSGQSITFLFNLLENYVHEDEFWNNLWKGKEAMESRFLCIKLNGRLTEEFDKEFDIPAVARENKMTYIRMAKHLMWLKELKLTNAYQRKYADKRTDLNTTGRHKIIYDEISWGIDAYSDTAEEYCKLMDTFDTAIKEYHWMLHGKPKEYQNLFAGVLKPVIEKVVDIQEEDAKQERKSTNDLILEFIGDREVAVQDIIDKFESKAPSHNIDAMLKVGDLVQTKNGYVKVLK